MANFKQNPFITPTSDDEDIEGKDINFRTNSEVKSRRKKSIRLADVSEGIQAVDANGDALFGADGEELIILG